MTAVNIGFDNPIFARYETAKVKKRPASKSSKSPRRVRSKPPATAVRESYRHGHLRDALVEESLRIMNERSDASFTLREVAHRIGVSHSAAYRHFPSKGALLAAIAQRGFELLTAALSQALEQGKTAEEVARLLARAYVRIALSHPAHFRCMFGPRRFTEAEGGAVDEAGEHAFACLAEAARRLQPARSNSSENPNTSLAMWSIVHGLAHLALDQQLCDIAGEGTIGHYENMAEEVVGILLCGANNRRPDQG